jgi:hypothetical protein
LGAKVFGKLQAIPIGYAIAAITKTATTSIPTNNVCDDDRHN